MSQTVLYNHPRNEGTPVIRTDYNCSKGIQNSGNPLYNPSIHQFKQGVLCLQIVPKGPSLLGIQYVTLMKGRVSSPNVGGQN